MEPNLFEQAKSMMIKFTSNHEHEAEDTEVIKQAIQAAYAVATPEEKEQLDQFERQLTDTH